MNFIHFFSENREALEESERKLNLNFWALHAMLREGHVRDIIAFKCIAYSVCESLLPPRESRSLSRKTENAPAREELMQLFHRIRLWEDLLLDRNRRNDRSPSGWVMLCGLGKYSEPNRNNIIIQVDSVQHERIKIPTH